MLEFSAKWPRTPASDAAPDGDPDAGRDPDQDPRRDPEPRFQPTPVLLARVDYCALHGETVPHERSASVAQAVVLSVWHPVHALGILYASVCSGVMNANV